MGNGSQYVTNPIPSGATPLGALTFVWYTGTRGEEHAKNWRRKLEREFPELWHAIEGIVNPETFSKAEQIKAEVEPTVGGDDYNEMWKRLGRSKH